MSLCYSIPAGAAHEVRYRQPEYTPDRLLSQIVERLIVERLIRPDEANIKFRLRPESARAGMSGNDTYQFGSISS